MIPPMYIHGIFVVLQANSPRKNSKGSSTAPPVNNIGNGSPVNKVPTSAKINTSSNGHETGRGRLFLQL